MKISRMNWNKTKWFFVAVFVFYFMTAYAQKKRDSLQNQTVTVVKSYTPTVRDADKQAVNPTGGMEVFNKIPVDYNPLEIEAVSTFQTEKGKLVRPQIPSKMAENIPGYAELAVGNMKALRLNAFYVHPMGNNWKTSGQIRFFNLGNSVKDSLQLSPYSNFETELAASHTNQSATWQLFTAYKALRSSYRDTLLPFSKLGNAFTNHRLGVRGKGEFYEGFFKELDLTYNYLSGYAGYEHEANLRASLIFPVAGFKIYTLLNGNLVNGNAGTGYTNAQAGIFPSFRLERERFLFKLGLKLFFQNRTDLNDAVLFYPDVAVDYNMVPELLTLYLKYDGGVKTYAYNQMITENPYVSLNQNLKITSRPYLFEGGFKGSVGTRMNYLLSLGMTQEKNALFYEFSKRPEGLAFKPVYDNLDYFYFKVNLSYVANDVFETKIKFDYFQYTPETLPKAWNKEDYKVSWLMRIHAGKFGLRSDLFYIGPRYNLLDGNVVKSNETVDLNLQLSYRVMKGLYLYAEGNNLLNRNDYFYYTYPLHGLHVLAGVTYSFR